MKQTWVTPRVNIQNFEANEYVAACWTVVCNIEKANRAELATHNAWYDRQGKLAGQFHAKNDNGTGCGWESNQVVVTDSEGNAIGMYETNTNGLNKDLTCVLMDGSYSQIQTGQEIQWYTAVGSQQNGSYRQWNHVGTVQAIDSNHPNRS